MGQEPGVKETKLTAEEKASAAKDQRQREKDFADELVEGLDLSAGVRKKIDEAEDEKDQDEEQDDSQEEDGQEEEGSEEGEEGSEEESNDDSEEGDDSEAEGEEGEEEGEDEDDADPKTIKSMKKRIDELTAKNKRLEARLDQKDREDDEDAEPEDREAKKLSKMSVKELRELKGEVKLAWKEEKDPKKSRELLALEEKIDNAISEAPIRFERQQLSAYHTAVKSTAEDLGEKFTKEAQQIIFKKAGEIFASRPSLQKSVDGQAMAWQLAAEVYMETSKFSAGKSRTKELERENNKLKKKTSLDVAVRKGNTKTSENERLFQKAKHGSAKDKLAFFKNELKTDEMLPENLRSR